MSFFLIRFFLILSFFLPVIVFGQIESKLPFGVEQCHAALALEYNRGEMKYKDWLIAYRQCYVDNGASEIIPANLNQFATSTNTFDNNFATADCVVAAQRKYNDNIAQCLRTASAPMVKYQNLSAEELIDGGETLLAEVQTASSRVQADQQQCYGDKLLAEFKKQNSECYKKSDFGAIWELPILKKALADQFNDYQNLAPEKSTQLSQCLQTVGEHYDLKVVSAPAQTAISNCFVEVGLLGIANVYEKISTVVDCAQARFPIASVADAARVVSQQSPTDQKYLEQCVIKRTAPVMVVGAVLNLSLVSGWRTVFLFGQLLVTQPIILYRRRKYKTWGKVFDTITTNPLDLSSVRLIDLKSDRVIATTVTNTRGSYLFLPNPGNYRVEVDKPGYIFPSALFTKHTYEGDHYFGEPVAVRGTTDVIDRHIPVDPYAQAISVWRFRFRQWRYGLATGLGFVSPLFSIIAFWLAPKWWVGIFALAQIIIFGIFIRLSIQRRARKFGVVSEGNKKSLSGVKVSLFRREDNKLLQYYITDIFGRYYFPTVVGDFLLEFSKNGYQKKQIEFTARLGDKKYTTVRFDATLERI